MKKTLVGIDEVGRGCLAGPVSVGAVIIYSGRRLSALNDIKCSKQLTELKRNEWSGWAYKKLEEGKIDFFVSHTDPAYIDEYGLSKAIQAGVVQSLEKLEVDGETARLFLDGRLKAPDKYTFQESIIKGDEKDGLISLASVVAKVSRDSLMSEYCQKYPQYGFEKHKGYGTKLHKDRISLYGPCELHRRTFLKI